MTYFGGQMVPVGSTKRTEYVTLSRMPHDLVWESSSQYNEPSMREAVLNHIKATAPGRLLQEVPIAGFVGLSGSPCNEHTTGARPIWVWFAEVDLP